MSTGRLKPINKPFDSALNYILHISFKLILLLVVWSWKCNNILKNTIAGLQLLVIRVCWSIMNIFPQWISKPCIRKHKNHSKASSCAGICTQNLREYKKSQYNVRNIKSGRHYRYHIFRFHNSRYKPSSTNIPYYYLKVKGATTEKLNPHLLVKEIECFMQLSIITILFFGILQEWYHLFYLSMNQSYGMITYSWTQNIMIEHMSLIKLIQIPIC